MYNGPPPGLPGDTISPPGYTPGEIERWAHNRKRHEREAVPAEGEHLLFRARDFGEAVPAVVVAVQDLSSPHDHWNRHGALEHIRGPGLPDPNVWEPDPGRQGWQLKNDPWPWVQVRVILAVHGRGSRRTEELGDPQWCREARVRGSAGWLRHGSRAHTGRYEE